MEPTLTQEKNGSLVENPEVPNETGSEPFNLYPVIRHIFLTLCILLAVSIILFLIYQNGKSIYDKGI